MGGIIHNYQEGECCYSCGKIWCGRQGIRLGNEPAVHNPTHGPIFKGNGVEKWEDLFLAFRRLKVKVLFVFR